MNDKDYQKIDSYLSKHNQAKNNISLMFWIAGWLFSLGVGACNPFLIDMPTLWQASLNLLITFMFWPFLLGIYFAPGT